MVLQLPAVDLSAMQVPAEQEVMAAPAIPEAGAVAEVVAGPVHGEATRRADAVQRLAHSNPRPDRTLVGYQLRSHAIEASCNVTGELSGPLLAPSDARLVIARRRIGVLTAHELEGIDVLQHQAVTHGDATLGTCGLIERSRSAVVRDVLRGVGVQGARIDVRAIGQFLGIRIHDALYEGPSRWVRGQRNALLRSRH